MKKERADGTAQPLCKSCTYWKHNAWTGHKLINCILHKEYIRAADMPLCYCAGYRKKQEQGGAEKGR